VIGYGLPFCNPRALNALWLQKGRPYLLILLLAVSGCTLSSEDLEFKRAEEASRAGKNEVAYTHYKTVVDRYVKDPLAIRSAQEAARLAHYELKRFPEAVALYKHVILYAPKESDRLDAQKKLADLYFSQSLDYNQAIAEYSRLLETPHSHEEDGRYRFAIARSYFYLNNFFQSTVEIDKILASKPQDELGFDALMLKANIFLSTKKLDDAILTLQELMKRYSARAKKETVGLVLAICYEEQKNYGKAIETLEAIKDDYPRKGFIDSKIKTLRERQSLQPGARGLHK
jgi:tetratricopeptide (TPR) repeat protein